MMRVQSKMKLDISLLHQNDRDQTLSRKRLSRSLNNIFERELVYHLFWLQVNQQSSEKELCQVPVLKPQINKFYNHRSRRIADNNVMVILLAMVGIYMMEVLSPHNSALLVILDVPPHNDTSLAIS